MMLPAALLLLGALTAVVAPRLLARADWPDREPVVALWVWQCVVAAVIVCCALSMTLSAAAAWHAVGGHVFATAPGRVVEAYALGTAGPWAATTAVALACGGLWSVAMLVREVGLTRARRRRRRADLLVRAPLLPGEVAVSGRLVVLESERPDAWWLPGTPPQLVVTTAALGRLKGRKLDAVLAHEQGHARARHDWLLNCSSALAGGFPQVPVFAAFPRRDAPPGRTRRRRHGVPPLRPSDHRPGPGRTQRAPRRVRPLPDTAGPCTGPGAPVADSPGPAARRTASAADGCGRAGARGAGAGGLRAGTARVGLTRPGSRVPGGPRPERGRGRSRRRGVAEGRPSGPEDRHRTGSGPPGSARIASCTPSPSSPRPAPSTAPPPVRPVSWPCARFCC
ncbi:integral membrane protein [Streptomyces viridochromogenes DSM 40736]|uniref:Integral membrane protein n=1 Tax=Streptomyces viridochromogenes (strain DSM 40736 / JCM 4977 / BCRC 1201 / Tue 494) TaxID=591159 RepID=D9XC48_STRVT|nr:integral membrane protein [Streptomyces viridochromogenes DSM 40736]